MIQQRYEPRTKHTHRGEIDPWLTDELYLHPKFKLFFDERAGFPEEGLCPTVTIRQMMWGVKMKPIQRERWRLASIGGIFSFEIFFFAKFTCSFMTKTMDSNEGGYKLCLRKQDGST